MTTAEKEMADKKAQEEKDKMDAAAKAKAAEKPTSV
jgi:hypothetical protein